MIDMELDRLIATSARITDTEVEKLDLDDAERALIDGITSSYRVAAAREGRADGRRRRRLALRLAAVGTAAVFLAGVVLVGVTRSDDDGAAAYAAEVVAVAEAVPRLLVDLPEWRVDRAEQLTVDRGELNFTDGEAELDLQWFPASEFPHFLESLRAELPTPPQSAIALGRAVEVFTYREPAAEREGTESDRPATGDFTAVWLDGQHGVEARGHFSSLDDFRRTLQALTVVDVETWLATMPESVVRPGGRAETVAAMLADISLPPGFDEKALRIGDANANEVVRDRYQLGADVTGAVVCAWIELWITATDRGDAAGAQRAVEAMASSHDWAILREMQARGAWPIVVWEYADAMPTDAPIAGGRPLTIRESYRDALGC